jgi:hypothetical protein
MRDIHRALPRKHPQGVRHVVPFDYFPPPRDRLVILTI